MCLLDPRRREMHCGFFDCRRAGYLRAGCIPSIKCFIPRPRIKVESQFHHEASPVGGKGKGTGLQIKLAKIYRGKRRWSPLNFAFLSVSYFHGQKKDHHFNGRRDGTSFQHSKPAPSPLTWSFCSVAHKHSQI